MSSRSDAKSFPIPRTHAGRYFQSAVGTPRGRLLRTVWMNLRLTPQWELVSEHSLKLVLVAWLVRRLVRKLQQPERPPPVLNGEAAAVSGTSAGVPEIELPSLRALLSNRDGSIMAKEATLSMLSSLVTSLIIARRAFHIGKLQALNFTKDQASWWFYVLMFPLNAAMVCLLQQYGAYMKDRTVLNWRRNVTERIHDLYFSHMGYYRLQNPSEGIRIPDPDIRLSTGIDSMCTANGNLYFSIVNAVVYTAVFGYDVISERDWKWSLLTPGCFFVAIATIVLNDHGHVALQGELSGIWAWLVQHLTHVQRHAERICMLQGEGFEEHLLKGIVQKMDKLGQKLKWVMLKRDVADKLFFSLGWSPLIEQAGFAMAAFMGCNDAIKCAEDKNILPHDPRQPLSGASDAFAGQINNAYRFFNTCTGWGLVTSAWFSLQFAEADTQRVRELYGSLNALGKQSSKHNRVFHDEGPVIAFDNVTVTTPSQVRLIEGLTVKVQEGQTLLICGHNGAGKSSIIRCLCGLWPVQQGTITRPGSLLQAEGKTSLHQQMYYLPQKPCSVLGTLSDQLTYPEGRQLPEEELRRWLKYVDLEHLADQEIGGKNASSRIKRGGGFNRQVSDDDDSSNTEIDWEVLLSLGEQQALSIARLLYHRPQFAILDECTSAVGKVLERRLFEICKEIGISCITITHRPTLKEHHARMLQLTGTLNKDGKGWKLTDLPSGVNLPSMKSRAKDNEEVHRRIEEYFERQRKGGGSAVAQCSEFELTQKRSKPYSHRQLEVIKANVTAEDMVKARYATSFQRLIAVLKLGLKDLEVHGRACRRLLLLVCFLMVRVQLGWSIWRGTAGALTASICGDKSRIFAEVIGNWGAGLVLSVMESLIGIVTHNLFSDIWQSTFTELQAKAFQHATFFKVMNPASSDVPEVEDPTQRLYELKKPFDMLPEQLIRVVLPMTNTMFLFPLMVDGVGIMWAPMLFVLNFCLFHGVYLIAPDFAKIKRKQTMLESRFQALHTRLRSMSESVAFSGAGHAERRIIESRFDAMLKLNQSSLRQEFLYQTTVQFFTEYCHLPLWTHIFITSKYHSNNNPTDAIGRGVAPCSVTANLLWDVCVRESLVFIQRCVLLVPQWKSIDAQLVRALEMLVAFEAAMKTVEKQKLLDTVASGAEQQLEESQSLISIRDLDLVTRHGVCLARGITFDAKVGEPILITGPSATGKSLLGNVLLGLWPASGENASVHVFKADGGRPPLQSIMPAPQRIYFPRSVLFSCLSYPYNTQDYYRKLEAPFRMFVQNLAPNGTKDALLDVFTTMGASGVDIVPDKEDGTPSGAAYISFSRKEDLGWVLSRPQDVKVLEQDVDIDYALYGDIATEQPENGLARVEAERKARMHAPQISRMLTCFRAVDIEHILTREEQGFMAESSWEDSLSGGEQQRLCFARVLYHQPIFGLLDECTSMVAADAEDKLYRSLFRDWGITPITLTQRLFMPDLYSMELSLGIRNEAGWELADVSRSSQEDGGPSVDDMYNTVSADMGLQRNVVSAGPAPAKLLAMPSTVQ